MRLKWTAELIRPRSSMDRAPDFESVGCAFESHRGCCSWSSILNYKSRWNPRTTGSHKRGVFYLRRMRSIIRRYRIYENHPWHTPLQEGFISFTSMDIESYSIILPRTASTIASARFERSRLCRIWLTCGKAVARLINLFDRDTPPAD